MLTMTKKSSTLLDNLAQFTGTERYYRINRKCVLTDGAKYLAETAGAYWLMDAAASYLLELGTEDWFVLVRLVVNDSKAVLTLEDGKSVSHFHQVKPHGFVQVGVGHFAGHHRLQYLASRLALNLGWVRKSGHTAAVHSALSNRALCGGPIVGLLFSRHFFSI